MKPGDPIGPRRLFFRCAARETLVWLEELRGRRHVKFDELLELPPEALAAIVPGICPGVRILPAEGRVMAQLEGAKDALPLFPADAANLAVFNRFNGRNTIGQVAAELSAATEWPPERCLEHVKGLFFRLLWLRVCAPTNAALPGLDPMPER